MDFFLLSRSRHKVFSMEMNQNASISSYTFSILVGNTIKNQQKTLLKICKIMSSAENGGQPFPLDEQTFEVNKTKRPADASVVAM